MTASRTAHTPFANNSLGTSSTITIPATAAGATLVVKFAAGDNSQFISGISGGSGTWAQKAGLNDANYGTALWVGTNITAGTTSITVTVAGSDQRYVVDIEEWAGLGAYEGNATIKSAGATNGSLSSNAYTTTNANDVVIGFIAGWPNPFTSVTLTQPSSPWSTDSVIVSAGANILGAGRQIVSATAAFTYTGSVNHPIDYHAYVVAFAQATAGPTSFGGGFFA